jgi:molybdopterin converting factor subunit 1
MNIRVLFFSVLSDITGLAETKIEMSVGANVGDLLIHLYERWPKLKAWDDCLLLAVNETYVKRDAALPENAEVAVMPPVQGG